MKRLRLIVPRYPYFNIYSASPMPPLGLVSVGTVVSRTGRYAVEIIDENNYRGPLDHRRLQEDRPADVVGIYGGLTSTVLRAYELACCYRGMGVPTLAGGAHVIALPEEAVSRGVDVVVLGEGEETVLEVLEALEAGRSPAGIPGLAYLEGKAIRRTAPRPPIADLDALPTPDFSLLVNPRRRLRFVPVGRTRGCNFHCEFCAVHRQFGPTRWASPERTFEQVRNLWGQGHRFFFVIDDNFAQDRRGTVTLLRSIIGWREAIQARSEVGRDLELLRLMQRAGVTSICIGLESPIDEDLRAMRKGRSAADMEADLANLHRHGFYIHGMFIFGYPQTEDSSTGSRLTARQRADRYLDFTRRTRLDTIQVMTAVPLPGTDLARRLSEAGRIYPLDEVGWDKYDGNWVVFEPDGGTSAAALQEEATRIMREFYRARVQRGHVGAPYRDLALLYGQPAPEAGNAVGSAATQGDRRHRGGADDA